MITEQNRSEQAEFVRGQHSSHDVRSPQWDQRSLLLCGGGTGGHVYPALAVASALSARLSAAASPSMSEAGGDGAVTAVDMPVGQASSAAASADGHAEYTLLYVGSPDGMERGLVECESDLPFRSISTAAVRGRNPLVLTRNSAVLARGVMEARGLIRRERPATILGTGGYVCVPLFVAARLLRVPTLVYLPDIVPGLAVKLLARLATRVACSFEPSLKYLPGGKTVVTGYPVRRDLFDLECAASRQAFGITDDLPVLLVYGGSRGARSVNRAIEALLPDLLEIAHIIHVCGREGDETWLRAAAGRLPNELSARYHLFPYLHAQRQAVGVREQDTLSLFVPDMVQAFGAADLAIARSGASTLAELPAARLPAVLVPYPYVNQDENADYLVSHGAAVKVADAAMLGTGDPREGALFTTVRQLLQDDQARATMAARSAALARPDATERIADELLRLAAHGGAA